MLAATNRPETLDKALLRPGRFDRRVIVEKPDLAGREAILQVHAAKVKMAPDVNLHEIALATSGATGADLANMINEGALHAVRMGREQVSQADLMESVEVVIAGKEKKDRIMNPMEKRRVAYHEVGHALSSALQKNKQPVQKITIVPRTMGSLGYTMQMPEEERYLLTKNELLAQITTLLSGRAAEEVVFGEASTGASNDIERATKMARAMVTQYGMSERFGMMGLESVENQYLDGRNVSNCSDVTGAAIDDEVRKIIASCHQKAAELLSGQRAALDRIASYLIEKETISGDTFMRMLNEANALRRSRRRRPNLFKAPAAALCVAAGGFLRQKIPGFLMLRKAGLRKRAGLRAAQEPDGARVFRVKQPFGRAFLDDLTVLHQTRGRPRRGRSSSRGDHHHRHALRGQVPHDGEHLLGELRVQRGGGLVKAEHLRPHGEGPGDGHALGLPAGELVRVSLRLVDRPTFLSSAIARASASSRRSLRTAIGASVRFLRTPCAETGCRTGTPCPS